jgi:hypothetical protein
LTRRLTRTSSAYAPRGSRKSRPRADDNGRACADHGDHENASRHRRRLHPVVSLWGLDFAAAVGGGAILTESVFNLHGVGQYAAQSIGQLDVPPVRVIVMFGSPRIRLS